MKVKIKSGKYGDTGQFYCYNLSNHGENLVDSKNLLGQ